MESFYSLLGVLELDTTVILSPLCYSSYPFTSQLYEFIGSIIAVTLVVVLFACTGVPRLRARVPKALLKKFPLLKRLGMSLLTLIYPLICNSTFSMLYCAPGRIADYSVPVTLQHPFPAFRPAMLLQINTDFECYAGDHLRVGVLAWFVLFLHVLGFPIVSLVYLYRKHTTFALRSKEWNATWTNFVSGDYKHEYFWYAHVNLGILFVLSMILVFGTHPSDATQIILFLLTLVMVVAVIVAMYRQKPYVPKKEWKMPIKALVLLVTVAGSLGNLISYFSTSPAAQRRSDGFAYFVFVLCLFLIAAFVYKFWLALVDVKEGTRAKALSDSAQSDATLFSEQQPVVNPMMSATSRMGETVNPMHKAALNPAKFNEAPYSPDSLRQYVACRTNCPPA